MENKLIDPYGLLGVDSRSSLGELKKNYYNLALLCHPDKGGNDKDMNVVSLAYNYIKDHLENVKETSYEKLEDEFEDFCKSQEALKPPTFGQIYEETSDWINEFNRQFEEGLNTSGEMRQFIGGGEDMENNPYLKDNNPMISGYGEYMEVSENVEPLSPTTINMTQCESAINMAQCESAIYEDEIYDNPKPFHEDKYNPNELERVKNEFKGEIIKYEEPQFLPDTITGFPLDGQEILDYSGNMENLRMSDYKQAFSPREELPEVEERDYPKEVKEYVN